MRDELFFNKESESGEWEIIYDSSKDRVELLSYSEMGDNLQVIQMSKKKFIELKEFIKDIVLTKNIKL